MDLPRRVAVFARNEERNITRALEAILEDCSSSDDVRVYVLANGCIDRTVEVVKKLSRKHPQVSAIELPFGDKANAWNTYVYAVADNSPCHFFTDGDVVCCPGSLRRMQDELLADDGATAIAGLPMSGRNREKYIKYVRDWHWIFGNLYAVKTAQLVKLRQAGIRLPVGICGTDHFVSKFMAARFTDPINLNWDQIIHRPDAGFVFRSLEISRPGDWSTYWNRKVIYALRQLQIPEIDRLPLLQLPKTMDRVNMKLLEWLDSRRLTKRGVVQTAVLRRLRRMYPHKGTGWFERLIEQGSADPHATS